MLYLVASISYYVASMTNFVADLHLHSAYARATSKELNFDTLTKWAKIKGIDLLSSADFTHPLWFAETKAKLIDSGDGLFTYNGFKFVLGAEVSCIFSQGGKLRRVHLLLFAPSLEAAEKINTELGKRGKLASDGRPILGLPAKTVLEIILEADPNTIMIPAHAWTPWFGVLGQNGGFNSLEECFGDLAKYIYAVETGLSSDPGMNYRVKELDTRSIVSFSDAHSAPKMGRELTIFKGSLSYTDLLNNLKSQNIEQTLEFFPEEGKYHYNGHRNCNFKETPSQTLDRGSLLCPVCKKPLTIGVMHRVEQLAEKDRPEDFVAKDRPSFSKMVPLLEIVSEVIGSPVTSKKVTQVFSDLVDKFGNEIEILQKVELADIEKYFGERLAEAISKVRNEDIFIDPGYDGVYGEVHIWPKEVSTKKSNLVAKTNEKPSEDEAKNVDKDQLKLFNKS